MFDDDARDEYQNKECTICKHYGRTTDEPSKLEKNQIYDEVGTPVTILLCRNHAVELFKSGQKRFLTSHYKILVDIISSDETKFIEVLERTVRENMDDIF